ncbi:hypothetical protein [Streptomyces litmocidini]|uniref:HEAT repeat domain-containing protein n=1 Tax=Streptomyces litmocidini TaxID=67318 RepID=A0ABW7U0J3_9ACTN
MSPALRDAVRRLEALTGTAVLDPANGHSRWELYRVALASDAARPALLAAVVAETDAALASGVVGEALERVPRTERDAWVQALAPAVRAFSARRTLELGILEDLRSGPGVREFGPELIDGWSDWLQLRIATEVSDPSVLRALAESGRTKRIRRAASVALG